jgi:hypothetical protein
MINTLTLEEAIKQAPAINADRPSAKASSKYSFISTRSVLEKAMECGWCIREAKQSRGGITGQHKVSLIHKSQLDLDLDVIEGFPQMNIINSHDLTKKFLHVMGYFRQVCSNGLIAPTGMTTQIKTVHRFTNDKLAEFTVALDQAQHGFQTVQESINNLKERVLSQEEKQALARFAYYIRFRYRMQQPRKLNQDELLQPRRTADEGNDLWRTFNVIQENITLGGRSLGKGITQFQDDVRFNQELWTGVNAALIYRGNSLDTALKQLFPKKERQKRSSTDLILPA